MNTLDKGFENSGSAFAKSYGFTEIKGYKEKDDEEVNWKADTKSNELVADQLIMQNEYWAAQCETRSYTGLCKKTAGKDLELYLDYNEYSGTTELPEIYDGAIDMDTFIGQKHTSGTLLLMNFQLKDKHGDKRFYVVEIEFDQADMDRNGGSFVPELGPFKEINVKIDGDNVSIDLIAKPFPNLIPGRKFKNIPKKVFWIANATGGNTSKRLKKKKKETDSSDYGDIGDLSLPNQNSEKSNRRRRSLRRLRNARRNKKQQDVSSEQQDVSSEEEDVSSEEEDVSSEEEANSQRGRGYSRLKYNPKIKF